MEQCGGLIPPGVLFALAAVALGPLLLIGFLEYLDYKREQWKEE